MMGYGYYGGMMDGSGWVWMVLVLAAVITLMVWGTRAAFWSRRGYGRVDAAGDAAEALRRGREHNL